MYRSGSSSRVSDEFFSSNNNNNNNTSTSDSEDQQQQQLLPTYNVSVKKEKIRLRSAETAVHVIPLLLILCAVILWFCSTPVNMASRSDSIAVRVRI